MRRILSVFALLLICSSALAAESNLVRVVLNSKTLEEDRALNIVLPADYDEHNQYATVYLLDGGAEYAAQVAGLMHAASPELIVVGIENTDRSRDMFPRPLPERTHRGGGGEAFLRFLTEEMVPYVESRYATGDTRVLVGQSNSGFFVLYAMTEVSRFFDAYLASSPMIGWDWETIREGTKQLLTGRKSFDCALYMNCGGDDSERTSSFLPRYGELLAKNSPNGFRWMSEVIQDEGHVPDSGFARGIEFLLQRP